MPVNHRWAAVGVFVVSSTLNFLDRGLLAALAPLIREEFHLSTTDIGFVFSAFAIAYALASPLAGMLLDRLGLNRGISILVTLWSIAGAATSATRNLTGLLLCRVGLGAAESGGIPAVSKMVGAYLPPRERALGLALGQIGISLGGMLAPILGTYFAVRHGWRSPFLVTGALGLLWIPAWLSISRAIPAEVAGERHSEKVPLRDPRLIALMVANVLWMGIYALWTNWTTLYLTDVHHLSLQGANSLAWIPPLISNAGGFAGGWLALFWMGRGVPAVSARLRVILVSALAALLTMAVPFAPSPAWAIAAISVSFFAILAGSVNVYAIPIDLYGPARAGFAVSTLVFAYGLLQTVTSPIIGHLAQTQNWVAVCWMVSLPPLLAWMVLKFAFRREAVA